MLSLHRITQMTATELLAETTFRTWTRLARSYLPMVLVITGGVPHLPIPEQLKSHVRDGF